MEIYTIRVRSNPAQYSNQHHMYNFVSDLRQVIVFLWYSGFFHQKNWPRRYSWNIVESGVKHHNSNPL